MDDASQNAEKPTVAFETADMLLMIAALTNAAIQQGSAVTTLALGDVATSLDHSNEAGKQIDKILTIFRDKLGQDAIDG